MITSLYAALLAILLFTLSLNVIRLRRKHRISHGDGNVPDLQIARSAQANAVDYIPITLLLLLLLELNQTASWLIHLAGIVFTVGRFIHAGGILKARLAGRVLGMHLTLWTILALALLNLASLPWDAIFIS